VSRGTRAVLYSFFAIVSLFLGSSALFTGIPIALLGESGNQPWLAVDGWLIAMTAIAAPILFVLAAIYALPFGRDE